jgi:DNA-directed RNA polymerase specialized sigma24 family protein
VAGTSGGAAAGSAVRRYCRARLGPVRGLACADRIATSVVAQVPGGNGGAFDRETYRAAVRAVDRALADSGRARRPVGTAVAQASAVRLAAAVEDLPAPVRDVLVLRTLVGLSREDVARALGVSDLTVLRRQQEAIRMLRVEEL